MTAKRFVKQMAVGGTFRNRRFQAARVPLIAGGLAVALTAFGLTWQFGRQTTSPTSGVQTGVPEAQAPAQDQAPDIRVTTLEGEPFSLADRRGRTVVVLFSASWCGSCIPEVQKMAKLQREYGGRGLDLLFLSVDPLDTPEDWARFRRIAEGPQDYWALDPGQRATLAYQIRATDTKVFIDRTGRVVARYVGPTQYGAFQTEVERLL